MSWTAERARLAALSRHRPANDPAVADAARDLRVAVLADSIRSVLDAAPPLTDAQRAELARLLAPTGGAV
jgi:hypothetical protein